MLLEKRARAWGRGGFYVLSAADNHEDAHVCKENQGAKQKLWDKHKKRNILYLDGSWTWNNPSVQTCKIPTFVQQMKDDEWIYKPVRQMKLVSVADFGIKAREGTSRQEVW